MITVIYISPTAWARGFLTENHFYSHHVVNPPTATRPFRESPVPSPARLLERFAPVTEQHQSCFTIQSSIFQKWQTVRGLKGIMGKMEGEETLFIGNVSSPSPISSRRFLRVPHAERFSPAHRELSFTAAVAACLYAATTGNHGAVCRCVHRARRRCRRFRSCCDGPSPNGTAAACRYGSGCRS